MPRSHGYFSWFFFVPAVLCLGFGCFFLFRNVGIIITHERARGIVTGFDTLYTKDHMRVDRLVVQYPAKDGVMHEVYGVVRTNFAYKNVGDTVSVYYLPAKPDQAVVATFVDFWLFVVVLNVVGMVVGICWYGVFMGVTASGIPQNGPGKGKVIEYYGPRDKNIVDIREDAEE